LGCICWMWIALTHLRFWLSHKSDLAEGNFYGARTSYLRQRTRRHPNHRVTWAYASVAFTSIVLITTVGDQRSLEAAILSEMCKHDGLGPVGRGEGPLSWCGAGLRAGPIFYFETDFATYHKPDQHWSRQWVWPFLRPMRISPRAILEWSGFVDSKQEQGRLCIYFRKSTKQSNSAQEQSK
jgi:hypothetical protein